MESKHTEGIKLMGVQKITKALLETSEHWRINEQIEKARESGAPYEHLIRELNRVCKTKVYEYKNLIPTAARTAIVEHIAEFSPTYDLRINYSALGTNNASPSNSDIALAAETYRRQIASLSSSGVTAYATAFYSALEVDGTFYEHGLFFDATATADSGVLFSRVLLEAGAGLAKSDSETLTIDYTLNIL